MRGEGGEIRAFAGIGPGVFGERGGGGFAGDEFDGEFGGAVEFAAEFAEVGGEFRIGAGVGGLGGFEVGFPGVGSGEFVGAGGQPGELGGPVVGGGGWQIGFLIPADHGGGGVDDGELTGFFENRTCGFLDEFRRPGKGGISQSMLAMAERWLVESAHAHRYRDLVSRSGARTAERLDHPARAGGGDRGGGRASIARLVARTSTGGWTTRRAGEGRGCC